jgi:hypothetical protein
MHGVPLACFLFRYPELLLLESGEYLDQVPSKPGVTRKIQGEKQNAQFVNRRGQQNGMENINHHDRRDE